MTLEMLAAPLKAILEAELAAGNHVEEVSAWPPKCELLVILRNAFTRDYSGTVEVEYAEINDSHYWKAEYRLNGGKQALACRFSRPGTIAQPYAPADGLRPPLS